MMTREKHDPVIIVINATSSRLPSGFKPVIQRVATRLFPTRAPYDEITVRIVSDAEMKRLNRRFKGKDRTTDVLAFQTGDVAVSLDRARAQARDLGHSRRTELLLLAIHGLLHLAGRCDGAARRRAAMLREGEELLAACDRPGRD